MKNCSQVSKSSQNRKVGPWIAAAIVAVAMIMILLWRGTYEDPLGWTEFVLPSSAILLTLLHLLAPSRERLHRVAWMVVIVLIIALLIITIADLIRLMRDVGTNN